MADGQDYIDLEQFHGANNILLRKKANAIMEKIKKSDNPLLIIENIIEQSSRAYATDNKYVQVQANVILSTLFENLRSQKLNISESDSISLMNKTSATASRMKKAQEDSKKRKLKETTGGVARKFGDVLSPFVPTPRTLLNAAKISNPVLGAAIDGASRLAGGDESSEKLFENIDGKTILEQEEKMKGGVVGGVNFDPTVFQNQLDVLTELLRFTKEVWGENVDSSKQQTEDLEAIRAASDAQVDNLDRLEEETKKQRFETVERMRESETDGVGDVGKKKTLSAEEEEEDSNLFGFGIAGAAGGLVGGAVGGILTVLKFGLTKLPLIGLIVGGVMSIADTFDQDKNLKNFGKRNLSGGEIISGSISNFFGMFGDVIDFFLGTDFGGKIRSETFKGIGDFFAPFDKAVETYITDIQDLMENPTDVKNIAKFAHNMLINSLKTPFMLFDSIFGTDVTGFLERATAKIKSFVMDLPEKINVLYTVMSQFFTEVVPSAIKEVWGNVKDFFTDTLTSVVKDIVTSIREFFTLENLKSMVFSAYSAAKDYVLGDDEEKEKSEKGSIGKFFSGLFSDDEKSSTLGEKPQTPKTDSQHEPVTVKNTSRKYDLLIGKDKPYGLFNNTTNIQQNNKTENPAPMMMLSPHPEDMYILN